MPKSRYKNTEEYNKSRRSDMSSAYDKAMPKPKTTKKKTSASTVGGGGVGSAGA